MVSIQALFSFLSVSFQQQHSSVHCRCLSGTPIHNSLFDLISYMIFLRHHPYNDKGVFKAKIADPTTKEGSSRAIQDLLEPILLRRPKGMPSLGLKLPLRKVYVLRQEFSTHEALRYATLKDNASEAARGGTYMHAWSLLLRLRQFCNHPALSDGGVTSSASQTSSTKMDAALEILRGLRQGQSRDKAIVFSQWTSMLDILETPLKNEGFGFRRLDGKMTLSARQKAIQDFSSSPEVGVILVSTKAASLGINLVAANHVIFCDLDFNPAVEDQAIDRAHRIGQRKDVFVHKLVISATVEERVLEIQNRKRNLACAALGGIAMHSGNNVTPGELMWMLTG